MRLMLLMVLVLGSGASLAREGVSFRVGLGAEVAAGLGDAGVAGRLVVYLIRDGAVDWAEPGDGPFFDDPQPMFGVDVASLGGAKGDGHASFVVVDDDATGFPGRLSGLADGRYRVQAVLDRARQNSSWKREAGNLFSETIEIELPHDGPIDLVLAREVEPAVAIEGDGVRSFEVHSELLSAFRGEAVSMRAAVVFPNDFDPQRAYAAVYEVPGFGGDHRSAGRVADRRARLVGAAGGEAELARSCFWIVLDPEGPNGHHLFADSANNGPVGRALVEELIPAIEAGLAHDGAGLVDDKFARLVRGHSSGGWSAVWLAVEYPEVFAAAWASSPDPVDFRAFQVVDIYRGPAAVAWAERPIVANMYWPVQEADRPQAYPSYVKNGRVLMTIEAENAMEEVLGPGNTSGQQWDSWQAVFGPRDEDGNPATLYDAVSGEIDPAVARAYRAYDITDRVRRDPGLGLIFRQRVRLICGDEDTFALDRAVVLLREELDKTAFLHFPEGGHGYIILVPGVDHGSIFGSDALRAFPGQMLEHLGRHGLVGEDRGDGDGGAGDD